MKILKSFMIFAFFQAYESEKTPCPDSHPYAYLYGRYCCQHNREKVSSRDGARCDGSVIAYTSSCCLRNEWSRCSDPPCDNNPSGYLKIIKNFIFYIYLVQKCRQSIYLESDADWAGKYNRVPAEVAGMKKKYNWVYLMVKINIQLTLF